MTLDRGRELDSWQLSKANPSVDRDMIESTGLYRFNEYDVLLRNESAGNGHSELGRENVEYNRSTIVLTSRARAIPREPTLTGNISHRCF